MPLTKLPLPRRTARIVPVIFIAIAASTAWSQASWVGDVIIDGEASNLWARCLPCNDPDLPPNTNWSTDRIPGDDGPLGDPGTGAVIGPDFVVDHNGGTLDLSTLNVQGSLIVGGLINISDSATINNIDLQSGGTLDGPGPVTLSGSGSWSGTLRSAGGVSNEATLTVATGDLEADLINNATLSINPSLDFSSTPSTLTNNGSIFLDTDTALNNNSNILDGSSAANLLLNQGTIAKSGADLSVIESPGNHAGGLISASGGPLRFPGRDWQFSGGSMQVGNNGQIELTGNTDHLINGTSGIFGQGSLLVNMATFGTLTVTQPFVVDLGGGSGEHGLLLQGIGINLEDTLTNSQGGRWSTGTINSTGAGQLVNESPLSDPFRIVSGGTKVLNSDMDSTGWIEQSSTVRIDAPHRLMIESGGGLEIVADPSSIDWNGDGEVVNAGEVDVQPGAQSRIPARFSQVEGAQVLVEGELDLRGGGMWVGNTNTVAKGAGTIELNNNRFEFGPGTHNFSEEDSTAQGPLEISSAELVTTATDAVVVFNIDFVNMRNNSAISGIGRFENRKRFNWIDGKFGVDGMIEFTNAAESSLGIFHSGNLLDGQLHNHGDVWGGITLTSDAVVNNSSIWNLLEGESILTTSPNMPGPFNNFGELSALSNNSFNSSKIEAHLNNIGSIIIDANTTLTITGPVEQLQNGELSGGRWVVKPGAMLIFPESFHSIGPGTTLHGLEGIEDIEILARIIAGEVIVTGELIVDGGLELSTGGRIIIDGQSSVDVPGGVQNGAPGQQPSIVEMLEEAIVINNLPEPPDVRGSEQTPVLTTPLLDNHAVIAPGGLGIPGPFNLDGDLVLHPGSTLVIDVGGPDPIDGHDLLTVTGSAQLGGTIEITVAEDFDPAIGQQFVIATAAATTGSFTELVQVNREDIIWSLTETANQVILSVDDLAIFADRFE